MKKTNLLILCILLFQFVFGQRTTNVETLNNLANQYKTEWENRKKDVEKFSVANKIPIRTVLPNGKIMQMVAVDNGQPVYYTTDNLGAAITTRANTLWTGGSLGLSLDGNGYTGLGEWDGGAVLKTHQEFTNSGTSRIIQMDSPSSTSNHATHVAGTLIAHGVNGNAKGMNYNGTLLAYDWNNDDSEMATAASNGLEISNHSYSFIHGWYWNGPSSIW